jgi:hypothetical protein
VRIDEIEEVKHADRGNPGNKMNPAEKSLKRSFVSTVRLFPLKL